MPLYRDKSHEELRSEDYQLFDDKGGFVSQNSNTKSTAFNASSASVTPPDTSTSFPLNNFLLSGPRSPNFTSSLFTGSFNAPTSRNPFSSIAPRTASSFPVFSSSSFTNSLTSSSCTPSTSVTLPASPFGPTSSSLFQLSSSPVLSVNPVSSATSVRTFPSHTPPIGGSFFANSPSTTSVFAPSTTVTVSEPSLFASSPFISTSISPSLISPGLCFTNNQPSLLLPRPHSGGQNNIDQGSDSQTTAAGQLSAGVTSGDCDYYLLYDPPQRAVERNKCLQFCLVLSCVFNLLFILIIIGQIY